MSGYQSIGLVGAGAVGQAVVAGLVTAGVPSDLLIASRTLERARALAADAQDMASGLRVALRARAVRDTRELTGCAVIVIAVRARFCNTAHGPDRRMGGLVANAPVLARIGAELRGCAGTILVVTNPVDLMTRVIAEASGSHRVFGVGSNLDTARYRALVAMVYQVPVEAVHARVIGQHGHQATILTSGTTIRGEPVAVDIDAIRDELDRRVAGIEAGIGRTRCGPAGAILTPIRYLTGLGEGVAELSAPTDSGVFHGQVIGFTRGHPTVLTPPLAPSEQVSLDRTVARLQAAYRTISFPTMFAPNTE